MSDRLEKVEDSVVDLKQFASTISAYIEFDKQNTQDHKRELNRFRDLQEQTITTLTEIKTDIKNLTKRIEEDPSKRCTVVQGVIKDVAANTKAIEHNSTFIKAVVGIVIIGSLSSFIPAMSCNSSAAQNPDQVEDRIVAKIAITDEEIYDSDVCIEGEDYHELVR